MSNKEENPSLSGYYSVEKFIKELKKISGIPENFDDNDDILQSTPIQTTQDNNIINLSPYNKNRVETQSDKDNNIYLSLNDNEKIKSEMTKLRKENAELKFSLNNMNKKFDNELKEIKKNNDLKNKELKETKEIMNKNASLIELLGEKISNYEKLVSELKEKQKSEQQESLKNDDNNNKYMALFENNKKLKKELLDKDKMINNIKNELNTKNEIFDEINTMKSEMETYLQTMDKLYSEIESRDGIIKKLKNDMKVIQNNYQQELDELKKQKTSNKINTNNVKDKSKKNENIDEKLLEELNQNKEKEMELNKELEEIKKSYDEMKESNEKMKELAKETNGMIKTAIDSRDSLKKEYESSIKEIVEKYEKQIKFMKLVLVKQKEEYEEKLKNKKNGNNDEKDKNEIKNDKKAEGEENKEKNNIAMEKEKEDETKVYEMMKIIEDNKELLKQNETLKNMNEAILSKMKELPNLEQKYTDLFETVKLLQEENHLLKEASKYSSLIELSEGRIKDMSGGSNIKNLNSTPNEKKTKNLLLDDEDDDDDENNEKDKKDNKDEEDNKNQKQKVPEIKKQEIVFDNDTKNTKIIKSNSDTSNGNDSNQIKIYNKKKLPRQASPNALKEKNNISKYTPNKKDNLNGDDNNINIDENDNEETVKEDETENNLINSNFNLYKPIKEGLLAFNLSKKNYYTVVPEKYNEFWESFDPETSVQYNTLEGLFLINAKKNNQLYYYSSKKNTFTALFQFKENHSCGCLFLDNLSKNIIAIGGKNSKLVEKFSFENGNLEQLPPLSTHRSKITCCQVLNKIYCFLGICEERPNESIIEYLDLDNLGQGWIEVQFDNQTSFKILTGMSCVNLNDSELFIIGGLINDNLPNEKLLYFSTEQNELYELNKDLPDSEDKKYTFIKNTMFNLFLNGDIISFTNIDDNNQVHVLDNDLKYDLYLTPKNEINT